MTPIGQAERETQDRIIQLFQQELNWEYLDNWTDRPDNSAIEEGLLRKYLSKQGVDELRTGKILHQLYSVANNYNETLYENNKRFYGLLRYGVSVKAAAGDNFETVPLIDWQQPENNHFALAEEVSLSGSENNVRPDIVMYVNGIALGVLELKKCTGDVNEGIRQNLRNQQKEYVPQFFSTMQFVFAGNDTEGLRYGTILTPEKYYLSWKEDEHDNSRLPLDKYLTKMCNKQRFLEIIFDFVIFDAGIKKLPRVHQYFAIKAAQEHVKRKEGGIIWHTQGSGKSIVMVLLAKWILENNPNARVAVITDRDELDKQIEGVFRDAGEEIKRSRNGKQLMRQLSEPKPRLLSSLIHKFGPKDGKAFDVYLRELEAQPPLVDGELFVFVDECHRSQSDRLHKAMKTILPQAVFVGFTGTPLLKKDKKTSLEVFGKYIHTYKFNEAVEDDVVLDLVYEARDIDQHIANQDKIDQWFQSKTKGLNDYQKAELKKKWGTMKRVLSSRSRMEQIVNDIVFDFNVKPRLSGGHGNAMLVAGSIYEACKYYKLFQQTELKGKYAIVTSYQPDKKDVRDEEMGTNSESDKKFVYGLYNEILGNKSTEQYEDWAKEMFKKEAANMKLLIVVSKLLTGFDAPSCTYIYLDKKLRDHGLFQAICRVNRLDGEEKQFGFVVDYMDLFKEMENAVSVYTSELAYDQFDKKDVDVMISNRLKEGRDRLEEALEKLNILIEPIGANPTDMEYIRYFCGNTEIPEELSKREAQRTELYKGVATLIRAYANIKDGMEEAGYISDEIEGIDQKVKFYIDLRDEIRHASGENIDLKAYEADMRHLLDNYIQADTSKVIGNFEEMPLLDVIVNSGIAEAKQKLPKNIRNNKEAVAETIENNVRKKIIKDEITDPAFYEKMSKLLDDLVKERKAGAVDYENYLKKIADIAKSVQTGRADDTPESLKTPGQLALYNNLDGDADLAIACDKAVKYEKKADWRGNPPAENEIKYALFKVLDDKAEVERIFPIIKNQSEY